MGRPGTGSHTPSVAPTPAVSRPPLPLSKPCSRPQTPAQQGVMPPPLPPSKPASGRQTPVVGPALTVLTAKSPTEGIVPAVGRGRAALLAKARTLTSQTSQAQERKIEQKPPSQQEKFHDNQSEVSFRSEDFETSSRIG